MSQRIAHRSNRRGNYMMTMGAFLPVLIGFAALSVDISYINMARTQAQNVADAASHAAFVGYRASNTTAVGDSAANYIMQNNLVGGQQAQLDSIEYGQWNFDTLQFNANGQFINSARAVVSRKGAANDVKLFFAPLLGFNSVDVLAAGVTAGLTREIIIVHDVSGSFAGLNIQNARNASIAFLDYLEDHPYPGDKIGMSVFAGRCTTNGCSNTAYAGNNFPMYDGLQSVTAGYVAMRAHWNIITVAESMTNANNPRRVNNWTSQFRGVNQARQEFIAKGSDSAFKAIILVSDGLPTCDGNSCGQSGDTNGGKTLTETAINTIYNNNNVHVWTVTFENGGGDFSWMSTLDRGLGKSYATPNSSELEAIMLEIASSIPVVLAK